MSQLGHLLPKSTIQVTSACPPRAEVQRTSRHFAFVPEAGINRLKHSVDRRNVKAVSAGAGHGSPIEDDADGKEGCA